MKPHFSRVRLRRLNSLSSFRSTLTVDTLYSGHLEVSSALDDSKLLRSVPGKWKLVKSFAGSNALACSSTAARPDCLGAHEPYQFPVLQLQPRDIVRMHLQRIAVH